MKIKSKQISELDEFTTDNVTEGTTNKYFSNTLARNAFTAGTGITITDGTIASTITQYTNEEAVDAVGAALIAGSHNGITFTYDSTQDSSNRIDASINLTGISIDTLNDVSTSGATSGQVLTYNGSVWAPSTISSGSGGGDVTWLTDVTANNTVLTLTTSNSMVLVKNGSNAWTVNLPAISGKNGKVIRIKRLGTGLVTIALNSADNNKFIDSSGTTSIYMGAQYSTFDLVANEVDGAWYLL